MCTKVYTPINTGTQGKNPIPLTCAGIVVDIQRQGINDVVESFSKMLVRQASPKRVVENLRISTRMIFSDQVSSLHTCKYELREYWYMKLMAAMPESTKKSTAPLLAAGLYPSLRTSISVAVFSASFSFSVTYTCIIHA